MDAHLDHRYLMGRDKRTEGEMRPAKHLIEQWRKARDDNDATGNLARMSQWLADVMRHEKGIPQPTKNKADSYAAAFKGVKMIHDAEGSIPIEIYAYRGIAMRGFLLFVESKDPDLRRLFESCL